MTSTPTSWGLLKQPYKQESTNVDQDGHYYRRLAMIFPSRKPIGKQADHTDGASGGCRQGRPGRNPASQDVSPIKWDNVILYGQYVLDRARVR